MNPDDQEDFAVLARIARIEPCPDGGGILRYAGTIHIFNGRSLRNQTGRIKAWCGTRAASVDIDVVYGRSGDGSPLWANICHRCFLEPRRKVKSTKRARRSV